MSFESNDNMNTIHLGNYEEFFILYMDHELSEEQVKMVDEFLVANPDLRAEFEILLSTRLPLEEFSFDKNDLLAKSMKLTSIDEELLLYVDNELPADKKKAIEGELASNKDYRLQHQVLLQTKLDPSEQIAYPNKKELHRRTERVIAFTPWMRVAAAVVIIAIGGMFYFRNSSTIGVRDTPTTADSNSTAQKNNSKQTDSGKEELINQQTPPSENLNKDQIAVTKQPKKKTTQNEEGSGKEKNTVPTNEMAVNSNQQEKENSTPERLKVRNVQFEGGDNTTPLNEPKVSINKVDVTSSLVTRPTDGTPIDPKDGSIANNDRKGSFKGFLRRATRMIEKRTGINPTNENGELLIGAVAINLK
jgi:hypothetical protein